MTGRDHSILRLAEHLLAMEVHELDDRSRQVIERAVRRHRHPLPHQDLFSDELRWKDRLADRVAVIGGSWGFILSFALVLIIWAGANSLFLTRPFDPYPYIFLNLLLSMLAAIQAPIIMMSQNRQAVHDRRQARRDFEINLKAELEILSLHSKLDQLLAILGEGRGIGSASPKSVA